MNCPSCHGGMELVPLQSHIGQPVSIDVCWPCHLIWFDHQESSMLSPGSVIELFKRIHAARDTTRNIVGTQPACPVCSTRLLDTSDIARGGRFTYHRCNNGHGRLIAFMQFLREKSFIRTLQPHEIQALAVTVKQVRCSSCGGPVNIERDAACTHCGSPISVLDEAAVEKALGALHAKEVQRTTWDPARVADALVAKENVRRGPPANSSRDRPVMDGWIGDASAGVAGGALADLVELGIGAALSAWLD